MSNIEGLGATRLVQTLLPRLLEQAPGTARVVVPDNPDFIATVQAHDVPVTVVRRRLPKALSRALEVLFPARLLRTGGTVLVLGDMPLRGIFRQVVFVHTPHLIETPAGGSSIKVRMMQAIFALTCRDVAAFIVQTEVMKSGLSARYGIEPERIHVVSQPPPDWVKTQVPKPHQTSAEAGGLRLFYPARGYPHKDHSLLGGAGGTALEGLVADLVLTVPEAQTPNPACGWIRCVGELAPEGVMQHYKACDALLFLSRSESYGLPLVEAMALGKPIICPDLPYARALCGNKAHYFAAGDAGSMAGAVARLSQELDRGAAPPDWSEELARLPRDWPEVANRFLEICSRALRGASPA